MRGTANQIHTQCEQCPFTLSSMVPEPQIVVERWKGDGAYWGSHTHNSSRKKLPRTFIVRWLPSMHRRNMTSMHQLYEWPLSSTMNSYAPRYANIISVALEMAPFLFPSSLKPLSTHLRI